MASGGCKIFIVEGEDREVKVLEAVKNFYFSSNKVKYITLPACANIYMLWKTLKEDDFETDIFEILKEKLPNNQEIQGLKRKEIDEIFLFFDYDAHQNNLPKGVVPEHVLLEMLDVFSNETEFGKLYISYPMIEAIRDWQDKCNVVTKCILPVDDFRTYKEDSAQDNFNTNIGKYKNLDWRNVMHNFIMRISCLFGLSQVATFEYYKKEIFPKSIYKKQQRYICDERIFVLSAIPEFILDYFPLSFWRSWIKIKKLDKKCCTER